MIGNDVVDLELASLQSNWQRKGYLDKIFTNLEQVFITKSTNQNEQVWRFWSRKEAVYKLLLQQGKSKGYYPKKIACLDDNLTTGIVCFENKKYYTKTFISDNYIHSIAVSSKANLNQIIKINWNENCIKINEIPYLKTAATLVSISKSHHGRFEEVVALNF